MATDTMENKGSRRTVFRLSEKPPGTFAFKGNSGGSGTTVPVFEPYEESLPLQSGWYSFVIDKDGDFRVKRGNTSSHGSMVNRQPVVTAGRFRVSLLGRVVEVYCESIDYPLPQNTQRCPNTIHT
jgi:hypothetical protein